MKNECTIVKDILPLYIENMISDETKAFVDAHLQGCPECKGALDKMRTPAALPNDVSAIPLKNIKNQLKTKRIYTVACAVAVVAVMLISLFSYLTAPQYIPYSEGPLSIAQTEDGVLLCTFSEAVTRYRIITMPPSDADGVEYEITAWYSIWDRYFSQPNNMESIYLSTLNGSPVSAYYIQNNGEEDVLLYGELANPDSGRVILPRLFLNFYFYMSIIAAVALFILTTIKRGNQKWKAALQKLIPLPVSYAAATILVKGFPATSYSSQRDLALIVLATVFIYLAVFMAVNVYQSKKERTNGVH